MDKNDIILNLFGFCRVFSPGLVPRQLSDETAVWCMCGDQVPVNLQTTRKCTGINQIYMLHINPATDGFYDNSPGLNTLRPRQNSRHSPNDIFKCIFINIRMLIKISLKFVPKGQINNIPVLVSIMAFLSELMMARLLTHICVTRPQWVNKGPDFTECINMCTQH